VAGASAAEFARESGAPKLDPHEVAAERDRVLGPLNRASGISWSEYEHELQDLMTKYVGMDRNEIGLRQAATYLRSHGDSAGLAKAGNGHELMRLHEAYDLRLFDEMMTAAALERDESRFSFLMGHYRTDRPHSDDQTWKGVSVLVSHDGSKPVVSRTVPTPSWRSARLAEAGSALANSPAGDR
jgi:succinate dehydrogenase/fumarate reductase flavoprotein subunit